MFITIMITLDSYMQSVYEQQDAVKWFLTILNEVGPEVSKVCKILFHIIYFRHQCFLFMWFKFVLLVSDTEFQYKNIKDFSTRHAVINNKYLDISGNYGVQHQLQESKDRTQTHEAN